MSEMTPTLHNDYLEMMADDGGGDDGDDGALPPRLASCETSMSPRAPDHGVSSVLHVCEAPLLVLSMFGAWSVFHTVTMAVIKHPAAQHGQFPWQPTGST